MIYVSEQINKETYEYLKSIDNVAIVRKTDYVYPEISSHPDIYMCSLGSITIHAEASELSHNYPGCCALNAACTGKYFIHNLRHTAPRLLKKAEELDMHLLDVPQGYTKCNVTIVDENSIITSDRGIERRCRDFLDVLLISESTKDNPYIKLSGFDYGFIGGASGKIGNEIIFCGSLSNHPDGEKIREFIKSRNQNIREFDYPLTDLGSIIYEQETCNNTGLHLT